MNFNKININFSQDGRKWIAIAFFILFLILLSMQLYGFFFDKPFPMPVTSQVSKNNYRGDELNQSSPLFTVSLFGHYLPVNLSGQEIKESMLDVEIVGIMYSNKNNGSQVLIRAAGGEEKLYVIGDTLPGGAIIKRINKQGIVVLHNGSLESLSLPKNELLFEAPVKPLFKE